jgi:hypothetical protein
MTKGLIFFSNAEFEYRPHRVNRVLTFVSSRPNWDSPTPSPAGESFPPPLVQSGGGGVHTRWEEGGGGGVPIPARGQTLCIRSL